MKQAGYSSEQVSAILQATAQIFVLTAKFPLVDSRKRL